MLHSIYVFLSKQMSGDSIAEHTSPIDAEKALESMCLKKKVEDSLITIFYLKDHTFVCFNSILNILVYFAKKILA